MDLVGLGNVGGRYGFYDVFSMKMRDINFNVSKDVFRPMVNKSQLKSGQQRFIYSEDLKVNNTPLHEIESKTITAIGSSGVYYNGASSDKALDEEDDRENYLKRVKGRVLTNFTKKSPISIIVPAMNFIEGKEHLTIGRLINLRFVTNLIDAAENGTNVNIDKKKSGEYLIFGARHMMKKEQYNISLTCVKLANLEENL